MYNIPLHFEVEDNNRSFPVVSSYLPYQPHLPAAFLEAPQDMLRFVAVGMWNLPTVKYRSNIRCHLTRAQRCRTAFVLGHLLVVGEEASNKAFVVLG